MPIQHAEHPPTPNLPDDVTEAIRLLYLRYGEAVYRSIYEIVLDAGEAQDLTQETFVRAYRAWNRFDRTNARGWLLRIATNLAITHYRSQRRHRRVPPWMLLTNGGVEEPGRQSEDKDLVAWLMRPLTPQQRALITLHYYQQIPRAEIAAQLGIPIGTVASRINKAMQVLRGRAQAIGFMEAPETVADRVRVSLPPVDVILRAAADPGAGAAGGGAGAATGAGHGLTAVLLQQWVAVMALIAITVIPAIHFSAASGRPASSTDAAVVVPAGGSHPGGGGGSTPGPSTHHSSKPSGSTPTPPALPSPRPVGSTPTPTVQPDPQPAASSAPTGVTTSGSPTPVPTTSPAPSSTPTVTPTATPTPTPTPTPSPTPTPTHTPSPVSSTPPGAG